MEERLRNILLYGFDFDNIDPDSLSNSDWEVLIRNMELPEECIDYILKNFLGTGLIKLSIQLQRVKMRDVKFMNFVDWEDRCNIVFSSRGLLREEIENYSNILFKRPTNIQSVAMSRGYTENFIENYLFDKRDIPKLMYCLEILTRYIEFSPEFIERNWDIFFSNKYYPKNFDQSSVIRSFILRQRMNEDLLSRIIKYSKSNNLDIDFNDLDKGNYSLKSREDKIKSLKKDGYVLNESTGEVISYIPFYDLGLDNRTIKYSGKSYTINFLRKFSPGFCQYYELIFNIDDFISPLYVGDRKPKSIKLINGVWRKEI